MIRDIPTEKQNVGWEFIHQELIKKLDCLSQRESNMLHKHFILLIYGL